MWEAHRLKRKYEDLNFGAVGTQGSVRVKEAGTGGAVTGEGSSCSFPADTCLLKNPIPREGQTWLVTQYVLGTVLPRLCKSEAWFHQCKCNGGAVTRSQNGCRTGRTKTPPLELKISRVELGKLFFKNNVEPSLESVELEDLFYVAPHL